MVIMTSKGFTNKDVLSYINFPDRKVINACVITTAALPLKENGPNTKAAFEFIQKHITEKVDFIDVEFSDPNKLFTYDLIYITGGNSFHLFSIMQQTKSDKIILELMKKNKIIIGSSAGAMFLSSGNKYNTVINPILNIEEKCDKTFSCTGIL
jgi:peptidase E